MLKKQFLSILFCVSAGSNDDNLGSDEQEIIDICNIIIDVNKLQVSKMFCSSFRFFVSCSGQFNLRLSYIFHNNQVKNCAQRRG